MLIYLNIADPILNVNATKDYIGTLISDCIGPN